MASYNELLTEQIGIIISEASDRSLREMFSKTISEELIDKLLKIDTSSKKKFAEWFLKHIQKDDNMESYVNAAIGTGLIQKIFNAVKNGEFQVFNYSSIKHAVGNFYDLILDKKPLNCVYSDDKINIYIVEGHGQLRTSLINKFGKRANNIHWCIACGDPDERDEYFDEYIYGGYNVYLIQDKTTNNLYLWTDSENNNYKEMPRYTEFNDWNNNTVDNRQILTPGAIEWFKTNCKNVPFDDIWEIYKTNIDNDVF